jgi:hypothetical protein
VIGRPAKLEIDIGPLEAIDVFADKYGAKYDRACLTKDRQAPLAFYPAEHWDPFVRTSNPMQSVFATVWDRTVRTKGVLSTKTAKLTVFKLVDAAAKT